MKRLLEIAVTAALLCFTAASLPGQRGQSGQVSPSCDRSCLLAIADTYLSALVAHDPSKAPMAPNAKFTEQGQVMAVGRTVGVHSCDRRTPPFPIPQAM